MKERSTSKLLKRVISGICVLTMIFSMGVLQAFSVSAEAKGTQNGESCTCNSCGFVTTDPNGMIGEHAFTKYIFNKDSTVISAGTETAICDNGCGASRTRTLDIDLSTMQIALPDNPTAVEKSAANELVLYIKKITGKTIPIVSESKVSGAAIYVGATKFAKNNKVTFPDDEFGEGWAIKVVKSNVVLTGGKTRGTLYAVYHLLEDVLGVRWWNMWEEYVPTADYAAIPKGYADSGVPAIEYRDIYVGASFADPMYFIRNRLNCWSGKSLLEYGGMESWGPPNIVHTFGRYFPAGTYFYVRPEWYAWSEAKNSHISDGQLCLSNEELYQAFEEKLLENIRNSYASADAAGRARPRFFDVSPNDVGGFCECADCKASVAEHGRSGYVLLFVNRLAAKVAEEYPDVLLETLAYWQYVNPPLDDTKPAKNVIIRLADNNMDILHSISHKNNEAVLERMQEWKNICQDGQFYVWDYGIIYETNGVFPSMYKYGENFNTFHDIGMNGYFLELERCIGTDFWDMKLWLNTKLVEDPTLGDTPEKYEALMDEFIYGYYGAAGQHIKAYLDYMHQRAEADTGHYVFRTNIIDGNNLTLEDIMKGDAYFEQALAAVAGDETLLRRVRAARIGLDQVIMENYEDIKLMAKALGVTFLEKNTVGFRLATTLTEQVKLRGSYDGTAKKQLEKYQKYIPKPKPPVAEPVEKLPEELANIDPSHIYVFDADTFNYYDAKAEIKKDADSLTGSAVVCDIGKWDDKKSFTMNPGEKMPFNIYFNPSVTALGALTAEDLIADGEYHLYKFLDNASPVKDAKETPSYYLYMFRSWTLQNPAFAKTLMAVKDYNVDAYVSMKVVGDVSCEDPENYPVYYIDRLILVTKCDTDYFEDVKPATCTTNEAKTGTCPICNQEKSLEIPGTMLPHAYIVYTPNGDGTLTTACSYGCGSTQIIGTPIVPDDKPTEPTGPANTTEPGEGLGTGNKTTLAIIGAVLVIFALAVGAILSIKKFGIFKKNNS